MNGTGGDSRSEGLPRLVVTIQTGGKRAYASIMGISGGANRLAPGGESEARAAIRCTCRVGERGMIEETSREVAKMAA